MTFTDYTENKVVEWLVGGQDMPPSPGNLYVALHSSDPGESPDGSTEIDSNSFSYERAVSSSGTEWIINSNFFENSAEIAFPEAEGTWGNITHFSIWDGPSQSDNVLAKSNLTESREVKIGDLPAFRPGSLSGQID